MSSLKKYRRVKYLGKGSYGAAILVELRSDPSKKFVIKEIVIGHLKPAEQASAKGEADVLHQMNHSNITMYVESFVENSKLYIVMEHADGGDLSGTIQKRKAEGNYYAEDEVMRIFVQICLALKHVHAANILHRDLKSQNIFLTLKGMVKLGDFGIAKVLDASDDQARTQIGTPYYLSPEICESKPYGRKSDVWSLGVVLYEIIALEMPFQAISLPALVVKICSGEPNYTLVATKYSPALIALTRSMLHKNPDKRPSLSQIVKTDFIMNHISKLLSYTIKMGNGGVVNVNPLLLPSDVQFKDADEADRNIELEKVRQREREGKDSQSNDAKRLEERDKLRRFKQDQVSKSRHGANGIADVEESKDSRSRGRSPTRGASPVRGGARSPARAGSPGRQRSPVRGGGERGNSPVRGNNRDAGAQRQNYDNQRNVGPAPKVAPSPAYAQQQQPIGRGKSLAEIQAEKQRDAMEAMRRGGGGVDSSSVYSSNSRHSQGGGADDRSAMVVAKGREDPYENAARREFFANRAAAQAAKARVEQDLHGGEGLSIISGRPNDTSSSRRSGSNSQQQSAVIQQPAHIRRNSDGDRGGYGETGGSRYSLAGEDQMSEAEARIAAIKAQKEKDRERELALKDMQLKQAIEDSREDRRRADERRSVDARKSACAFDIDLSGEGVTSKVISPPPLRGQQGAAASHRRRESGDSSVTSPTIVGENSSPAAVRAKPVLSSQQALPSINKKVSPPPTITEESPGVNESTDSISGASSSVRQKKGWGQPVNPSEVQIATGVARFSANDKSTAHDMFSREQVTPTKSKAVADSGDSGDYSSVNSSRMSLDGVDDAPANDSEVRRFLANKRASQVEARQQAKVVFKKLREQKQKEAETKVQKRVVRKSTIGESKSPSAPLKARLMDVMSSVDAANDSVQKAMAAGSKGSRQSVDFSAGEKGSAKDSKDVKGDIENEEEGDEDAEQVEEELQDTLGNWLQKQRRGVTTRSRRGGAKQSTRNDEDEDLRDLVVTEDDIPDESFITTSASINTATMDRRDDEVEEEDDFPTPERVLLSDDMGNDVEVVGLQCMLAEALMREDVDTDEEDN